MPYSPPGVVVSPLPAPPTPPAGAHHHHHAPRPAHRRSYTFAADDPRAGPGAFASLGMLPRRTSSHGPSSSRKFHFRNDDDSSSSSDEPPVPAHDDDDGPPPPLKLRQPPAFRLTPATGAHRSSPPRSPQRSPNSSYTHVPAALSPSALNVPVPFPRSHKSSNSPSSPMSPNGPNFPARPPGPARTSSHPVILLSNGKPLKSSLKSSSSAPHVWTPGSTNANGGKPSFHLRARSAPSTPQLAGVDPTSPGGAWDQGSDPLSPGTPKAVHFPAPDAGLEDIRLFKRSARPASVSFPLDDETETETETDSQQPRISAWGTQNQGQSHSPRQEAGYPFPKVPAPVGGGAGRSPLNPERQQEGKEWRYALDAPGVPRAVDAERDGASMVLLEGMWLAGAGADPSSSSAVAGAPGQEPERQGELTLHGTLLARNAAFEKQLYVRFTLDGWCTTSEVGGRYVGPAQSPFSATSPFCAKSGENKNEGGEGEKEREEPGPGWDRFAFSIRLTDYAHSAPAGRQHTHTHAQGLRERGVGGVGRGLEGRELVLVARFFAPWVRAGGVAPYAWCDTLPQHTPAQQMGTDVSPSGRAWVGAGGGGAGEWWDNNGGRDYRVGFRCVGVEPTPAPATNIIPFPRASSPALAPPPSTLAPSPAPSEVKPTTIPPPPPPRTAHAQALAAKLGRLSLRNYAAPGRAVSLPSAAAAQVPAGVAAAVASEKEQEKETAKEDEKKQEEETDKKEKEKEGEKEKPGTQSASGVGLYWPWGRAAVAAPPAPAPPVAVPAAAPSAAPPVAAPVHDDDSGSSSSDDEEEGLRDAEAGRARRASGGFSVQGEGEETPPTSPLGAGGLLPALEEMGLSGGEEEKEKDKGGPEDVPLPESPERVMSPSPARRGGSASPPTTQAQTPTPPVSPTTPLTPSAADASSSLYKAFVRQWCFAGNGSGGGASGGVSPPVGTGAVLGGLV
ncbi:hypothetical protein DFH08DRAFT_361055 [Mycena albidolilacea]|uniref:CBM21 domain-containing protein n=1 Tax=Mycena albidolilacea TaxID=1033008 RepID=A0AAD7EZZ3_9AGAR|nr:hypothetical protein DFH08DRAFT_361055 [Mycena albidolilacea]